MQKRATEKERKNNTRKHFLTINILMKLIVQQCSSLIVLNKIQEFVDQDI